MKAEKIVPSEDSNGEDNSQADVSEKITREAEKSCKGLLAQAGEAEARAIQMKLEAKSEGEKKKSLLAEAEGFEAGTCSGIDPAIAIQLKKW